jgi:hypothetical protein
MDYILSKAIPDASIGFPLSKGTRRTAKYITDLAYADDIATLSLDPSTAQVIIDAIASMALPFGLIINRLKTEAMIVPAPAPSDLPPPLTVPSGPIKWVTDFEYLGNFMESPAKDMYHRLDSAWQASHALSKLWRSHLSDVTKVRLFQSLITPILFYGSETWVLTKYQRQRFYKGYNRLLRYSLNIHFSTHTTTVEVYNRAHIPHAPYVLTRRTLNYLARTRKGPVQPVQHVLAWCPAQRKVHGAKRAYHDHIRRLTGAPAITPANKRIRYAEFLHEYTEDFALSILRSLSLDLTDYPPLAVETATVDATSDDSDAMSIEQD